MAAASGTAAHTALSASGSSSHSSLSASRASTLTSTLSAANTSTHTGLSACAFDLYSSAALCASSAWPDALAFLWLSADRVFNDKAKGKVLSRPQIFFEIRQGDGGFNYE